MYINRSLKAFDRVNWKKLIIKLKKQGIMWIERKLIHELYQNLNEIER